MDLGVASDQKGIIIKMQIRIQWEVTVTCCVLGRQEVLFSPLQKQCAGEQSPSQGKGHSQATLLTSGRLSPKPSSLSSVSFCCEDGGYM